MDYTKGPWILDPRYDYVRDSNWQVVANCAEHPDSRANAHLIAAAPELYKALENLTFYIINDGVPVSQLKQAVSQAQQALAKVE